MLDLVLENGLVVTGDGSKAFRGSVGIKDGVIVDITKEELEGLRRIDCQGKIIAPGFIDSHSHGDLLAFLEEPYRFSRIAQGITTDIVGQCGISPSPFKTSMQGYKEYIEPLIGDIKRPWDFSSVASFMDFIEGHLVSNIGILVGQSTLRAYVKGMDQGALTKAELEEMGGLYEAALKAGALGLSLGLSYLPGAHSEYEELEYLGRITKKYERIIMAHIRSHSKDMLAAMEELGEVGIKTGAKVHISHCRSYKNPSIGISSQEIIAKVEELRKRGCRLSLDQHPYTRGSTFLNQLIPPSFRGDGKGELVAMLKDEKRFKECLAVIKDNNAITKGWDNFILGVGPENIYLTGVKKPKYQEFLGQSLVEIGTNLALDPFIVLRDILIEEEGEGAMVIREMFGEEDIRALLKVPGTLIGSDGLPTGLAHPRLYGAFPKVLKDYVRDNKVLTLEKALAMMTGDSAKLLGIKDRGFLKKAYKADIVVFDLMKLEDGENYVQSAVEPTGIDYVFLRGQEVLGEGKLKKELTLGQVIKVGEEEV